MLPEPFLNIVVPFLIVTALVGVIAGAVYLVLHARVGEPFPISLPLLFKTYLYVASLVSLVVTVGGMAALLNAGFAQAFGKEFSYQAEPVYLTRAYPAQEARPGEPQPARPPQQPTEEERAERAKALERQAGRGLVDGTVTTAVAGLLFLAHWIGRRVLEPARERETGLLNRGYVFILLLVFGLGTVITLPGALRDSVTYLVVPPVEGEFHRAPGGDLASAILLALFWAYYLLALLRQVRRARTGAS